MRGKAEHGVVEKDYRVRLDQGLGRGYVGANEHPELKPNAPEHTGLDPDLGGRGLRAHNVTQNRLAAAVREAGYEPTDRPKPDEPQYDLAWEAGDVTWVAEVKSVTPRNEERQLRTALGQVLRYRQLLEADGRTVRAMIAAEVEPSDQSWADLCAREGIVLVWGPENLTVSEGSASRHAEALRFAPVATPRKSKAERVKIVERASEVDWSALPVDERWTAKNLGMLVSYGFTREQVAAFYGQTPHWVSVRMARLRRAIEAQLDAGSGEPGGATMGPPDPPR